MPNVAKGKERVGAVSMTKDGPRADIMDEVWMCAQIDECIAATDRMEEVGIPLLFMVSHLIRPVLDSTLLQLL